MPFVSYYLLIAPIVFLGEVKEVKDEEGNWMLFYYHFMRKNNKICNPIAVIFFFVLILTSFIFVSNFCG